MGITPSTQSADIPSVDSTQQAWGGNGSIQQIVYFAMNNSTSSVPDLSHGTKWKAKITL